MSSIVCLSTLSPPLALGGEGRAMQEMCAGRREPEEGDVARVVGTAFRPAGGGGARGRRGRARGALCCYLGGWRAAREEHARTVAVTHRPAKRAPPGPATATPGPARTRL